MNTAGDDNGGFIVMPGAGRPIALPDRGAVATLKALGSETGNRMAVVETSPAPGAPGLPMHRHHRTDEALYILEGTVTVRVGGRTDEAGAGTFVFIPRGTAHMFRNPGPSAARVLLIFAPAGVERFLEATAEAFAAASGQPDPQLLREIRTKHDTELVEAFPPSEPRE